MWDPFESLSWSRLCEERFGSPAENDAPAAGSEAGRPARSRRPDRSSGVRAIPHGADSRPAAGRSRRVQNPAAAGAEELSPDEAHAAALRLLERLKTSYREARSAEAARTAAAPAPRRPSARRTAGGSRAGLFAGIAVVAMATGALGVFVVSGLSAGDGVDSPRIVYREPDFAAPAEAKAPAAASPESAGVPADEFDAERRSGEAEAPVPTPAPTLEAADAAAAPKPLADLAPLRDLASLKDLSSPESRTTALEGRLREPIFDGGSTPAKREGDLLAGLGAGELRSPLAGVPRAVEGADPARGGVRPTACGVNVPFPAIPRVCSDDLSPKR